VIEVFEIKKSDDCRYMTVSECLWENGRRHMRNAGKHLAEGRSEYAVGSMRKAWKNFQRSRNLTFGPISAEGFWSELGDMVASNILDGTPRHD